MARRPRVAFVVARCGADVVGGAERLCLETASHMAGFWDVEILTTCATDYVTWKNEFAPGVSLEGDVRIRRFPVDRVRDAATFARLSVKLVRDPAAASSGEQRAWMTAQGPACSGLSDYLDERAAAFDAVYFYSYLYATTYDNLPRVAPKAVLVSLAHDEWMLRLPMWERIFGAASCVICLTEDEERLLESRFGWYDGEHTSIVPVGVAPASSTGDEDACKELGFTGPFALYVGRVDRAKNCDELVTDFLDLVSRDAGVPDLVLLGPVSMPVAKHRKLHVLGTVSEEFKRRCIGAARFVVVPSLLESLSLAVLESWVQETPVLVNGGSSVLVGQCRRSGGGLWYANRVEFQSNYATTLHGLSTVLGRQGHAYVRRFYDWNDVAARHRGVLTNVRERPVKTGRGHEASLRNAL